MRVVIDRLRIELRDGRVEAAEELTSERIEGAAEVGGAWLFVGREGAMHTSASFTGPLRPLRASDDVLGDAEMLRVVPNLGAASVVDEDGRAWRWDGRLLRALPFGDVVGAVWRGEEGVAIVRYDAVRVSRDGGATWREVAVPAGVPLRVGGHATGLYVDTSEARYRVRGDALVEAARYPQERPADVDLWPSHRPLTFNEERRVAPWIRAPRREAPRPPERTTAASAAARSLRGDIARFARASMEGFPAVHPSVRLRWPTNEALRVAVGAPNAHAPLAPFDGPATGEGTGDLGVAARRHLGSAMECWWRGLDARGSYRASTRVPYPAGVTSDEGWSLLRATREALFYSVYSSSWTPSEFQDRGLEDDPWATVLRVDGRGVRRFRGFNAFGSADPPWVVPREAGGAILLWRRRLLGPVNGVWTAVVVDAAGRELGRRSVAVSRFAVVAGAGELGAQAGLAVTDPTGTAFTLLPVSGGRVSLGAPWPPREVAVCSERAGGAAVVHVRAPAVKLFEEDGTEADGQYVTLATFERAVGDEGPPCLRAISVNNSARGGGTWLRARGGRMEGVIDTGRSRAPVSIAAWGADP